jgi:hypothetical protein
MFGFRGGRLGRMLGFRVCGFGAVYGLGKLGFVCVYLDSMDGWGIRLVAFSLLLE